MNALPREILHLLARFEPLGTARAARATKILYAWTQFDPYLWRPAMLVRLLGYPVPRPAPLVHLLPRVYGEAAVFALGRTVKIAFLTGSVLTIMTDRQRARIETGLRGVTRLRFSKTESHLLFLVARALDNPCLVVMECATYQFTTFPITATDALMLSDHEFVIAAHGNMCLVAHGKKIPLADGWHKLAYTETGWVSFYDGMLTFWPEQRTVFIGRRHLYDMYMNNGVLWLRGEKTYCLVDDVLHHATLDEGANRALKLGREGFLHEVRGTLWYALAGNRPHKRFLVSMPVTLQPDRPVTPPSPRALWMDQEADENEERGDDLE